MDRDPPHIRLYQGEYTKDIDLAKQEEPHMFKCMCYAGPFSIALWAMLITGLYLVFAN